MQPTFHVKGETELELAALANSQDQPHPSPHTILEKKRQYYLCELQPGPDIYIYYYKVIIIIAELQKYSANSHAVFTNSELSLKYINVYGFDVDYTLAQYSNQLHQFIYQKARDSLVEELNVSLIRVTDIMECMCLCDYVIPPCVCVRTVPKCTEGVGL